MKEMDYYLSGHGRKKGRGVLVALCLVAIIVIGLLGVMVFVSCDNAGDSGEDATKEYTIQYADDAGTHTITVVDGAIYSLESIPERYGYEFVGLFDAEEGGVQYVNSKGMSLSAFTDKKNLVLFPQFKVKEYMLVLDYQGAPVTGSRSVSVSYGSNINELPMNLSLENKKFMGWYTEPNCEGVQVADSYGILPLNSKITEKTFNLDSEDGSICLYAGFKGVEYTVSFYFGDSGTPEDIKVEHGTDISKVIPTTRVDGKAVITWSKSRNDTELTNVFTGKVTSDMILYAAEYAPIIEFNSNGGNEVVSLVAREGESVSLPTPARKDHIFMGWRDNAGNMCEISTMPSKSMSLNAVWQKITLVLNENGGKEVADISVSEGEKITLPTVEREGYIFAGWYTEDGEKYENTAMPFAYMNLYAKYYKVEKKKVVAVSESETIYSYTNSPIMDNSNRYREIDLTDLFDAGIRNIKFTVHYSSCNSGASGDSPKSSYVAVYSTNVASDAYKICSGSTEHTVKSVWKTNTVTSETFLTGGKMYICFYGGYRQYNYDSYFSNVWLEIEYPDMSTLY